ncbi:hypothetical protein BgiMline_022360 [Biomphalaria glabrata]|nr:hypothetical protein BgiMline_010232 [Biomphalaria glabrata]KAI8798102.1 hypothetical protein BgiBS90_000405 [Biomphalaria glabrata]
MDVKRNVQNPGLEHENEKRLVRGRDSALFKNQVLGPSRALQDPISRPFKLTWSKSRLDNHPMKDED